MLQPGLTLIHELTNISEESLEKWPGKLLQSKRNWGIVFRIAISVGTAQTSTAMYIGTLVITTARKVCFVRIKLYLKILINPIR